MIAPRNGTTSAEPILPDDVRAAAGEAAFLRLLGLLFERPRPGWAHEIRSLTGETTDGRLRDLARTALTAGEGEYLAVFGPGGTVSPREVACGRFADPGRVMADLSGIYAAFAFRPRAEDPMDHVAVETGFAGYLALKEAYALSLQDRERAFQVRTARTLFIAAHLRPLATAIRARLAGATSPHLAGAAAVLAEWAGCPPAGSAGAIPDTAQEPEAGGCAALFDRGDADPGCLDPKRCGG